jgi:predicted phage gp36 major capsid-like protein
MAADNAKAAQQQAAIRQGTRDYANQVHSNVAANRAAALDHSSQQFALHMGDQAIYSDPSTGQQVQMSNQYGHAWASTTGNTNEYILTDSPTFNPNGQVGSGSWTQMKQEN